MYILLYASVPKSWGGDEKEKKRKIVVLVYVKYTIYF
jgi:hypothetical protein